MEVDITDIHECVFQNMQDVEALTKRSLAKKYSTMERLCMWPISGSELVDVTYLIT